MGYKIELLYTIFIQYIMVCFTINDALKELNVLNLWILWYILDFILEQIIVFTNIICNTTLLSV